MSPIELRGNVGHAEDGDDRPVGKTWYCTDDNIKIYLELLSCQRIKKLDSESTFFN
jgi:hypothetical protein